MKATKFCKISILLLSYVVPVKSETKISQNFVAFSEYMNFTTNCFVYLWVVIKPYCAVILQKGSCQNSILIGPPSIKSYLSL